MNTRKIKKYLYSLIPGRKPKRRAPHREFISIREVDGKRFKKRKKKIVSNLLRKFALPFEKINIFYYSLSIGILLIGGIVALLFGPLFSVKDIYISRGNSNVNIDLAYKSVNSLRGKKIFTIDTNATEDLILQHQKSLKNTSVDLKFPSTINIETLAYESVFQTHIGGNLYNIVENGAVIPSANTGNIPYLHIYNQTNTLSSIPDYKQVFHQQYIESIISIKNSLIENIVQLQIQSLHYYVAERELIIVLESGGELIFDLTRDLAQQVEKLVIFHNESGDITKKNLIYTDLRINNKVFFCDTTTEFLCRLHIKTIYGVKQNNAPEVGENQN